MNSKRNVIISILLIAIIIILLVFCKFGKLHHNDNLIPTGNVDVFDIDVFCNHKIADNNTNEKSNEINENIISEDQNVVSNVNSNIINEINSNTTKKNGIKTDDEEFIHTDRNGETIPAYNEYTDKNILGKVFVDDKNGNYLYQERLNIFTNAAYKFTNKIAPGSSNVYHFVVHNSNNTNVKYYIQMYEESEYKVNMKYRLKCEGGYAIGNDKTWVSAKELTTKFKNINKGSSDSYSLEWKWFDDDKSDTIAGKNMNSEYKLNIRFFFEAVNS